MNIQFRGEEIEVVHEQHGTYIAPTADTPAEYPNVIIYEINYNGVDVLPILSDSDVDEIHELLNNKIYG
jgi:hypothetical protein